MSEDVIDSSEKDCASPRPLVPASPLPRPRSQFSTHVVWTFAARVLMTVNSVIAGIIVARWLGAEGLGQLAVINVAVGTLVQLASLGLPSANTYFIARDKRQLRAVAINSLMFALVIGALLAAGLTWMTSWRPDWFGFIPPKLMTIAAVSLPFQLLTFIGLNIFLALGRITHFNLLDLAGQAFVVLNAVVALLLLHGGLWV